MTVPPTTPLNQPPGQQPLSYESVQTDPRRMESPIGRLVCWTIIWLCVGFIVVAQYLPQIRGKKPAAGPGGDSPIQQFQMSFVARYVVGSNAALKKMGQAKPELAAALADQLRQTAKTNLDRFETAIVVGELLGPSAALEELDKIKPPTAPGAGAGGATTSTSTTGSIATTAPTTVPGTGTGAAPTKPDAED